MFLAVFCIFPSLIPVISLLMEKSLVIMSGQECPSEIRFREGRAPVKFELIEPDIKELISKQSFEFILIEILIGLFSLVSLNLKPSCALVPMVITSKLMMMPQK